MLKLSPKIKLKAPFKRFLLKVYCMLTTIIKRKKGQICVIKISFKHFPFHVTFNKWRTFWVARSTCQFPTIQIVLFQSRESYQIRCIVWKRGYEATGNIIHYQKWISSWNIHKYFIQFDVSTHTWNIFRIIFIFRDDMSWYIFSCSRYIIHMFETGVMTI